MAALLVYLNFAMGPVQMLKLYGIPYWVCSISLCFMYFYEILHAFPALIIRCAYLNLHSNADFCYVVGLGDLLAPPWL